jgi:hypothetical protein
MIGGGFRNGKASQPQESLANETTRVDQSRCQHPQTAFAKEESSHTYFAFTETYSRCDSAKSIVIEHADRASSLVRIRVVNAVPLPLKIVVACRDQLSSPIDPVPALRLPRPPGRRPLLGKSPSETDRVNQVGSTPGMGQLLKLFSGNARPPRSREFA